MGGRAVVVFLACAVAAPGCKAQTPPADGPRLPGPDARIPLPNREVGLELQHDSVGWEVATPFVAGSKRDERTYLTLAYASLDKPELFALILAAHTPIDDQSLIAKPDELCHPSLLAAISASKPGRLLLRVTRVPS